jgi:DNA-binding response OmpR family regulator
MTRISANYLRKQGFKVTAVANGRRMNAAVESNAIELIVLDLMLQGESDSHLDADSSRDGLEYSAPAARC